MSPSPARCASSWPTSTSPSSASRVSSTPSRTCARTPRCRCPRATSRRSRAPRPSSAGCTGRASTCAPASPPTCRPPSRSPSTRSAWRERTCSSTPKPTAPSRSRPTAEEHDKVSVLEIRDLHVSVGEGDDAKEILRGVDLTVRSGETHAIMGPNGSGKSTLAYSIAGHPKYTITGGTVTLDGEDVLAMKVDERARAGLFLAMQYPVEVPGVSVSNFLRTAATAVTGEAPKLRTWVKDVRAEMGALEMDPAFAERNVNEGFSGGEKKRHEILQMRLLKPKIAILDETDSGLDVDALRVVSEGVNRSRSDSDIGVLLITHYTRILRYIKPDFVHVFVAGRIVDEGGPELAAKLEDEGYAAYVKDSNEQANAEKAAAEVASA